MFDLSHLGTLTVIGPGAEATIQRAFTNDVSALPVGRAHYTLCLNADGGIVDDLLRVPPRVGVLRRAERRERGGRAGGRRVRGLGLRGRDVKDDMACIAVQGPMAADMVTAMAGIPVGDMAYLDCRVLVAPAGGSAAHGGRADGPPPEGGVLARSGYTGERGYELFLPAASAPSRWDDLLGCRDRARRAGRARHPAPGDGLSPARPGHLAVRVPGGGRAAVGREARRRRVRGARRLSRRRWTPGRRGDCGDCGCRGAASPAPTARSCVDGDRDRRDHQRHVQPDPEGRRGHGLPRPRHRRPAPRSRSTSAASSSPPRSPAPRSSDPPRSRPSDLVVIRAGICPVAGWFLTVR